jgi:hypothetical protein
MFVVSQPIHVLICREKCACPPRAASTLTLRVPARQDEKTRDKRAAARYLSAFFAGPEKAAGAIEVTREARDKGETKEGFHAKAQRRKVLNSLPVRAHLGRAIGAAYDMITTWNPI